VYRVHLERAAERDLKRLSPRDFWRVVSRIKALADDPRPRGCRKITGSESDWRIRVGSHRVVYGIDDAEAVVRVMKVRHTVARCIAERGSLWSGPESFIHPPTAGASADAAR